MTPRLVEEVDAVAGVPLRTNPEWRERFPWLVQGTTWRGEGEPFDLGVSGGQPIGRTLDRWRRLREALGARGAPAART